MQADEPERETLRVLPFGISDDYAVRVGRLIQATSTLEMMLEGLIRSVTGLNHFDGQILIGRLDIRGKIDSLDALLNCRMVTLKPGLMGHWKIARRFMQSVIVYRNWLAHGVLFYPGDDDPMAVRSRGAQPPRSAVATMPISLSDLDDSLQDASTALEYLGNLLRIFAGLDVPLPDKLPEPKRRDRSRLKNSEAR